MPILFPEQNSVLAELLVLEFVSQASRGQSLALKRNRFQKCGGLLSCYLPFHCTVVIRNALVFLVLYALFFSVF